MKSKHITPQVVVFMAACIALTSCIPVKAEEPEDFTSTDLGDGYRRIQGDRGTELTEVPIGGRDKAIIGRDADGEKVQCFSVCLDNECSTVSVQCK